MYFYSAIMEYIRSRSVMNERCAVVICACSGRERSRNSLVLRSARPVLRLWDRWRSRNEVVCDCERRRWRHPPRVKTRWIGTRDGADRVAASVRSRTGHCLLGDLRPLVPAVGRSYHFHFAWVRDFANGIHIVMLINYWQIPRTDKYHLAKQQVIKER